MPIKNFETYYTVHLGRCLGFYDVLAGSGAMTPGELAVKTGAHEGYVRYWLEDQAKAGLVEIEETTSDTRLFRITSRLAGWLTGGAQAAPTSRRLW